MFQEVSTDLLSAGYSIRFRACGLSMHPTIRDGEPVIVEPVEAEHVCRGDIILYVAARGLIAHRIVAVERKEDGGPVFHLLGDAARTPDAPIMAAQVLGRIVSVERKGRVIALQGRLAAWRRFTRRVLASLKVTGRLVWQRPRFILQEYLRRIYYLLRAWEGSH